ncbi:cytochrome P450 [Xylogone sp. PMI_703]|nr:cytochrome P450 [Xylogone sp. PMI_703]
MDLLIAPQGQLEFPCLLAAGAGVLSHIVYFIRGFRDAQTVGIITTHLVAGVILYGTSLIKQGLLKGLFYATAISASYYAALFTSIVIYRLFFHPLRRFPGPFGAKVSKLYGVMVAQDGKLHEHQNDWVRKYGDIIRIAPNELLIVSLDAQQKIHNTQSKVNKKNTLYDFMHYNGAHNLDSILDKEEHRWRRQVWDKALNTKALEKYEAYTREVAHTWLNKVASLEGQPINTSLYSLLIPFDNMGKMGYSTDFGTVKVGKEDRMLHLIECTFAAFGKLGQLSWPVALAKEFNLSPEQTEFEQLACKLADEREKNDSPDKEDIMKYMLEDYHSDKPKAFFNRNILYSDSQVIMIGGTDTIAVTMSYCFYYLARDASLRQRLRDEVSTVLGKSIPGEFTHADLSSLDLLNAVIDECLRIHSPTCSNGARHTPPGGLTIDGVYVPGDVTVFVGVHAIQRSPKYFVQPDEFIPERWTTRPELVIDRRAFHPFMVGPYNCVGKRMALIVLRLVLAYTVLNYDFKFAPGEDGTRIHKDAFNNLILKAGKLECVFEKRE